MEKTLQVANSDIRELAILLALMIPSGFIGGLLFGLQRKDNVLAFPSVDKETGKIDMGIIADVLYGVAGALVIFLLIPFEATGRGASLLKFMGLAMLGGWGGAHLLDMLFKKTVGEALEKARSAEASARSAVSASLGLKDDVERIERRVQADTKLLTLITKHLNGPPDPRVQYNVLLQTMSGVTARARVQAFRAAREVRLNIEKSSRSQLNTACMRRVIDVLTALTQTGPEDEVGYLYYANLGYAYLYTGEAEQSLKHLGQAIEMRNKSGEGLYPYFEKARAVARIRLFDPAKDNAVEDAERIIVDLETAGSIPEVRASIIADAEIMSWVHDAGRLDCLVPLHERLLALIPEGKAASAGVEQPVVEWSVADKQAERAASDGADLKRVSTATA